MLFIVSAKIEYASDSVICFDPNKIVFRLMEEFPEIIVCYEDYGWRDYDLFKRRGAYEGAIRTAENDARRRAPIYIFRFRNLNGQIIRGKAERYFITIQSDKNIPAELKQRLLSFFDSLKIEEIEIDSYRLEGNDHFAE